MKDALHKSGQLKYVMIDDILDEFDKDVLLKMTEVSSKITFNDDGLSFKDENGDVRMCPNSGTSISHDGEWLSERLPDISFDINQDGNLRKSEEAQSAYCLAMVNMVLSNEQFTSEFENGINSYDFITFFSHF